LLIQAITEKGNRNLNITLDPYLPATTTITRVPYNSIQFDANELAEYLRRAKDYLDIERKIRESREKMLQEVVIKAKKSDETKKDSRRMMYGEADNTIKFDATNSSGATNIFDVIQGRVAGLSITGSGQNRTVQIRGAANFGGVIEPLFILDGMTVDKSTIMSISPFDVEAVDIIKGAKAAMYGSQGSGGVIAILTKRGNDNYDASKDVAEGVLVTKIAGYSTPREFYAPRYDKPIAEHVRPDFRATLHWSPMIQTDKEGKAKVSFFTSDAKTQLRLHIEGITQEGITGVANAELRVVE
jgi:hypothetical protein